MEDSDEELRVRIAEAIQKGGGVAKVAEKSGIPSGTLNKYLAKTSVPSLANAAKIAAAVEIPLDLIAFGPNMELGAPRLTSEMQGFVNLPRYDVRASAGLGLFAINEMPVSETAFERNFLRDLGGAPDHCFIMWSKGDSMLPAIPDSALLIVDSSQTIVDDGRIYVFNVGNAVLVKRARWRMDGRLELASDNVAGNYPVETFDADRVEDLTVVGRVIFVGHRP